MSSAPTAADARASALAEAVAGAGLQALLVTNLLNVRYLTGFTGTSGVCVIGPSLRGFFTDSRYTERARAELGEGWEMPEPGRDPVGQALSGLDGRVGFEASSVTVREFGRLEAAAPDSVEFAAAGELVESLRAVKSADEVRAMAYAAKLTDGVYEWATERGLAGRTEAQVARDCAVRMLELGAEPSFPAIVATGPNGAIPHHEPGDREIVEGDMVVFDMGARFDGYCSDCTRTFAVGAPSERQAEVYGLVLEAQEAALKATRPGIEAAELDGVARSVIAGAGRAEQFDHGLGHGVGLELHEAPRIGATAEGTLEQGNAVTIEPGVYVPGEFGVRIEDLVVLEADGYRNLSSLGKELTEVG